MYSDCLPLHTLVCTASDASVDARLTCGEEVAAIRAAPHNWSKEATNTPLPHKK